MGVRRCVRVFRPLFPQKVSLITTAIRPDRPAWHAGSLGKLLTEPVDTGRQTNDISVHTTWDLDGIFLRLFFLSSANCGISLLIYLGCLWRGVFFSCEEKRWGFSFWGMDAFPFIIIFSPLFQNSAMPGFAGCSVTVVCCWHQAPLLRSWERLHV